MVAGCAYPAMGNADAAPATALMKSRRFIQPAPEAQDTPKCSLKGTTPITVGISAVCLLWVNPGPRTLSAELPLCHRQRNSEGCYAKSQSCQEPTCDRLIRSPREMEDRSSR